MSMLSSIWLFLGILAFAATLGCTVFPNSSLNSPAACNSMYNQFISIAGGQLANELNNVIVIALGVTGVTALIGIVTGSVSFPNPYLVFGTITVLLLSMAVFPSNIFSLYGVPEPFSTFFNSIFVLGWVYGCVAFFKGDL